MMMMMMMMVVVVVVVVVICDDLVLIFDLLNTIYAIRYILMKPQNLTENKG